MTKSKVSDYTTLPSTENFTLTVSGVDDYSWTGTILEWDPSVQLLAGEYHVMATYGSIEEEGFDKPYFNGESSFTIAGGQTVTAPVEVSLKNSVVWLSFSEYFKKYYSDYSFTLSRASKEIVTFTKDEEDRAAFVDGYQLILSGTLQAETKTYTFSKNLDLNPATAYKIIFDVTNVGGASISISIKDGYAEEVDLKDCELND